ncbi:hypothetical protein GGX14DRAFT_505309 [Mycena pura]|uniref:RRM domain-containing protein n=1 Tax=Mycena pura TaxID=153505 RepID=A0AAD6UW64_9AGAR|nr:hypothetical protein GGX14DRAFT_505309 [Mycena pura]
MLVNALRRQARTAAAAAIQRTHVSVAARLMRPNPIALRTLSTTLVRRFENLTQNLKHSANPPNRQLFLGNMPYEATESDLREILEPYGQLESVRMIMNPDGSSRGFGYATFATQQDADAAFHAELRVMDRVIRSDYTLPRNESTRAGAASGRAPSPPGRVLFVGNLPFGSDEADLREKFEPFGPIKSIRMALRDNGESRGFAHVEYMREEDSIAAFESFVEEPLYMLDRNVRVDYAPTRRTSTNPPSHKLYFYDFRGTEDALRSALKEFGSSVQHTFFLRNQMTGELTGSGFVEFMAVERATEALENLNGKMTPFGPLNLEYSAPRSANSPQRGAGGDGQRGYGGGAGGGRGGYSGGRGGYSGGGGRGGGYGGWGGFQLAFPPMPQNGILSRSRLASPSRWGPRRPPIVRTSLYWTCLPCTLFRTVIT